VWLPSLVLAGLLAVMSAFGGCASGDSPSGSNDGGDAPSGSHGTSTRGNGGHGGESNSSSGGGGHGGTGGNDGGGGQGGSAGSTSSSSSAGGGGGFVCAPVAGSADYPAETENNDDESMANPLDTSTKGFTGALCPFGDLDHFAIDVPSGGSIHTKVSNGAGGCPAPNKISLRVLDSLGNTLVSKNTGPGGCPDLTPAANPSIAALAAGTYYIQVRNFGVNPIPEYVLDVEANAPSCSDGLVQVVNGEQCDDTNNTPGDGCSDICKLESGNYLNETEPNDDLAGANSVDGFAGAVGSIFPAGDHDFYDFTVTVPGSSVTIEVSDGFGGCPQGFSSTVRLFDPAGTQLVSDSGGGVGNCSLISPALDAAATNLQVGTHAIEVFRVGDNTTQTFYVVDIKVMPPGCGDSVRSAGEQCDDGNQLPGDGCSATCQFEKNYIPETELNDSSGTANALGSAEGFIGSIGLPGDRDFFSFIVSAPQQSVVITVDDGLGNCPPSFNPIVRLFDGTNTQIAVDDDGGAANCSRIMPLTHAAAGNLALGTYTVRVDHVNPIATQDQYVVAIALQPACSDGVRTANEQCDDGNTVAGDGCSPTCLLEGDYLTESESNDTIPLANALGDADGFIAAIGAAGDRDHFKIDVTVPGSSIFLETDNGLGVCPQNFNSVIRLFDPSNAQIVVDDNSGVGNCSKIDSTLYPAAGNLPVGTYTVRVDLTNTSATNPFYVLRMRVE
jgi:cysteine-rich repeat protein